MREQLLQILEEINPELVSYTGENMLEDGLLESVDIMEIVANIEEMLGIDIEPDFILPEYFENISTLEKFIQDVQKG